MSCRRGSDADDSLESMSDPEEDEDDMPDTRAKAAVVMTVRLT